MSESDKKKPNPILDLSGEDNIFFDLSREAKRICGHGDIGVLFEPLNERKFSAVAGRRTRDQWLVSGKGDTMKEAMHDAYRQMVDWTEE